MIFLLFVVSQASISSENVIDEVSHAIDEQKKVLPVKIEDCKVPFRFRRLQFIDLYGDYEGGLKKLIRTLNGEKEHEEQILEF